MTWEPKNKTDDDDDAMLSDDDKEKDDLDGPHHTGHMDKQRDHKGKVNLPFFTINPQIIKYTVIGALSLASWGIHGNKLVKLLSSRCCLLVHGQLNINIIIIRIILQQL